MDKSRVDKLQKYVSQYLDLWDLFGVIQVIRKGEVVFERSCGHACLEFNIPIHAQSLFSLASVSKQFTAFAIMLLHDRGKLDIDQPAHRYLPPNLQISDQINVHHLLSHTSGLYNFINFDDDFFGEENRLSFSQDEFFAKYFKKQPTHEPNERYDYNNSNYHLLAWIIEHVSGMSFGEFLSKNIFEPLHMVHTTVDDGDQIIVGKTFNYVMDYNRHIKAPYSNEKFSIGAGAIVSNCEDLYKWHQCLRDRKLLTEANYKRFFKENLNHYCYGLEHSYVYGTDKFSHGGDNMGISTYMQNYFAEDLCVLILSNNECINQYKLGNAISDILHGVEVPFPTKIQEVSLSRNKLESYCGTYLQNKIQIELINGKMYFTRFKGNLHIEIYPVGNDQFARRYFDQPKPYQITFSQNNLPQFFGYTLQEGAI